MDDKSRKTLEFDRITAALAEQASSSLGRELALALVPSPDRSVVVDRLAETAEAHAVLQKGERPPFGGITDIRPEVERARRGGTVGGLELFRVAEFVRGAVLLRAFLRERHSVCSGLAALIQSTPIPDAVSQAIRQAITEEGEVADAASAELSRLRRGMRVLADRVRDRMNAYLRSTEYQRVLQEPIITIREGRYVLPVRNDARSSIPGVVHDVSSSGATVFVEPMPCVPINNELRRVQAEEQEEVRRILSELSAEVGAVATEFWALISAVTQLDFAFAKARLALAQRAHRPALTEDMRFAYPGARHPLIPDADVVPVDVHLGRDFTVLVITGPNTGGKTVTLKTAGLLSLMVQSGLYIPTDPDPTATVFDQVLADIGDEQSIEQSLSTFSSHLRNIVRILEQAGPHSLVLLDEIGAGTDPTEGAALATALLEELHARGCRTVATTHYGQLKEFAYSYAGVANGSVSFDPVSLAPTYRLNIGVPGPSNALVIAQRLGLPEPVAARARSLIGEDRVKVEEMIQRLLAEREGLESDRSELAKLRRAAAATRLEYEARVQEQRREHDAALARVRGELRQAVAQARRDFDELIKELRASAAAGDSRTVERSITEFRERLRMIRLGAEEQVGADELGVPESRGLPSKAIKPGLKVFVHRLGQTGRVLAEPDTGGQVPVQVGILRVMADLADLSEAAEDQDEAASQIPAPARAARPPKLEAAKAQSFASELDLRGLTVEEALLRLDKYLDDAVLVGARRVRIIHGKGTGALREAVRTHLRGCPSVSANYMAAPNEGGDGVTIVELSG